MRWLSLALGPGDEAANPVGYVFGSAATGTSDLSRQRVVFLPPVLSSECHG